MLGPASRIAAGYFNKNTVVVSKQIDVIEGKGSRQVEDILTVADQEVEDYFRTNLKKLYPQIGFIGEESRAADIKEYNWIIDPIDGTQNFVWRVPLFCHSIALWKGNEPIYGLVHLPMTGETMHAFKGNGFYFNNQRVSRQKKSENLKPHILYALVNAEQKEVILSKVGRIIPYFRHYGSMVLHGVLTASGKADLMLGIKIGLWDLAAVILFGQESGCKINWLSPKPEINDKKLSNYKYTLVMGEVKLADKVTRAMKGLY